jgi:hypothetical protein
MMHPDEPRYAASIQGWLVALAFCAFAVRLWPVEFPPFQRTTLLFTDHNLVINSVVHFLEHFRFLDDIGHLYYPKLPSQVAAYSLALLRWVVTGLGGTFAGNEQTVMVFFRFYNALLGALTVWLLGLVAARIGLGRPVALLASLLLAFSANDMFLFKEIRIDASCAFLTLFILHLCLRFLETPNRRLCLLAGACVGLSTASREYGVFNSLVLAVAVGLCWRNRGLTGRRAVSWLILGALAAILAFVAGNWPVLLHLDTLLAHSVTYKLQIAYAVPMVSSWGDLYANVFWYPEFLATTGLWFPCFVAAGAGAFLFYTSRQVSLERRLLLGVFPLVYGIVLVCAGVRTDRYVLPLYPYFFLFAAVFCHNVLSRDIGRLARALFNLFFLALPIVRGFLFDAALAATSTRDHARAWMQENLPPGSGILVSGNSLWLGAAWQEFCTQHPLLNPYDAKVALAELRDRGFDYLLTGENQFEVWYQRVKDQVQDNPFMAGHRAYYRDFWLEVEKHGRLLARFSNPLFEAGMFCSPGLGASNYLPILHQPVLKVLSLGPWIWRPVEYPASRLYASSPFKAEHNLTLVQESGGEEVLRLNTEPGWLGGEGMNAYYNGPYDLYAAGTFRLTMRLDISPRSPDSRLALMALSAGGAAFGRLELGPEDMAGPKSKECSVEFTHPPGPDMQIQFHVLARDCLVDIHSAQMLRLE